MYIPKLDKNKFDIVDKDKDGYRICLKNPLYNTPLFLNATSKYILDSINGKNSVEDIEKKILARYSNADKTMVKTDLSNTLLLFYNLRVIDWVGKNPYEEIVCYRDGELYFYPIHNIEELILGEEDYYIPYEGKVVLRNKEIIEYESLLGQKVFFGMKINGEKVCEVGIEIRVSDNTLLIKYICLKSDVSNEKMNRFLDWIIKCIGKHYEILNEEEFKDIRMILFTNGEIGGLTEHLLKELKFDLVGQLTKEFTYGDMGIYVRM